MKLFKLLKLFNLFPLLTLSTLFPLLKLLKLFPLFVFALTAVLCTPDVYAGVITTKHNLSVSGPGSIKAQSETGICVFCHTPHGSITSSETPLWNHTLSSAVYTVPSKTQALWTTLLTTVGQPDKGAKACLSCHDGTVAIGAVANTPGPGSTGSIPMAGGVTTMPAGPTNLTTDISGHHPVSIAVNDPLRNDKLAQCTTGTAFYIEQPVPASQVKLRPTAATYGGQGGYVISGKPSGVQCASCHDPHNDPNGKFLVTGTPQNSTPLCTACHVFCP